MISYLKGTILLQRTGFIILETGGVGYKVGIKKELESKEAELFIHEHIKEEAYDLYGFESYDELDLFEKLISVNGVGPKVAMSIMTISSGEKIIQAIINEDIAFFQSVPGIGKKVAAKVILDLKGKAAGLQGYGVIGKVEGSNEILDALESLGYKGVELARIVQKIPSDLATTEDKIKWCLKNGNK